MQKKILSAMYALSVFFLILSCSTAHNNNLDKWLGNYSFNEPPIQSLAGYNMIMIWDFSVTKIDDKYKAILNVDGQQTSFSLLTNLSGNDSTLFVTYNSLLSGGGGNSKAGDTLFTLIRTQGGVLTRWKNFSPLLSESSPAECGCFIFNATNSDKNILKTPM